MSDKRYIDLPKAVELVLSNIAERGEDYKYTDDPWVLDYRIKSMGDPNSGCFNLFFDNTDPALARAAVKNVQKGCLVGSVYVDYIGGAQEMVEKGLLGGSWSDTARILDIKLSQAAQWYLGEVQRLQDDGYTWGEAHSRGLEYALASPKTWGMPYFLTLEEDAWLGSRSVDGVKEIVATDSV